MLRKRGFSLPAILILLLVVTAIGCSTTPAPTTAPAPTTTAPAPTTKAPVPTTTAPAPTTTAPAPTTTAPAPTSSGFTPTVGPAPTTGIKYGGTLKIGVGTDAVALGQPQLGKRSVDGYLATPAIERLKNTDSQANPVPWLAESWKEDYSTKTLTIYVRKGVKFTDGTDFNAAAVKWNLEMLMANKASTVANVKSVDIIDDYTVRVNAASWIANIADNMLGSFMVSPTAWKTNGQDWGKQNPVGTGPFKLASRQRDVNIKYVKNTDYWMKGKPYLDAIEFDIIADKTTRVAAFKAGEIDMFLDPSTAQADELKKNPDKYVVWNQQGGQNTYCLGPAANDPNDPFSKLQVRQALGYAVDKQVLVNSVLGGYGTVATQQNPPGTWPYNPDLKGYPYDVAKAKQLLAEAGYPNGFETSIMASSIEANDVLVCTALQGMLSQVGIKLKLNLLAAAALEQARRGGWTGINLSSMPPAPSAITLVLTSQIISKTRYIMVSLLKSPTLDAAAEDTLTSPDMKTFQAKVWNMMDLVYYKEAMMIPMYYGDALLAKYKYVKNDYFYLTGDQDAGNENTWLDR
jgi:peptide/nickel transport system substrate-binding protein